jgi:hypothetical protein
MKMYEFSMLNFIVFGPLKFYCGAGFKKIPKLFCQTDITNAVKIQIRSNADTVVDARLNRFVVVILVRLSSVDNTIVDTVADVCNSGQTIDQGME